MYLPCSTSQLCVSARYFGGKFLVNSFSIARGVFARGDTSPSRLDTLVTWVSTAMTDLP